jgi:hypothetical protein
MRKCIKDAQITYTDVACPPAYEERAVAGPPVNFIAAQTVTNSHESASTGKRWSTLFDVLDLSSDEKLRERTMEQTIEGKR